VFPELLLPPLDPEDAGSAVCPLLLVPPDVEPTGCEPWTVPPLPLEPEVGLCAVCPDRNETGGVDEPLGLLERLLMMMIPRCSAADTIVGPLGSARSRDICSPALRRCARNAGCAMGCIGLTIGAR
jgi:hypothetical protein